MKMTFYSESFFGSDSDTGPAPFTKIALSGTDWHSTTPNNQIALSFYFNWHKNIQQYNLNMFSLKILQKKKNLTPCGVCPQLCYIS